ncbi:MAG: hypothetical protein ACK4Y7_03900 [Caldimicrobium sp.]
MLIDLYCFSYTGTSLEVAKALSSILKISPKVIKTYRLPYFLWLITSFIPSFKVPILFEKPASSYGILVFPKWTFNCPPVTAFLEKVSFEKLLLVICYGGWREKPYGEYYRRFSLKKSSMVAVHYIKKKLGLKINLKNLKD